MFQDIESQILQDKASTLRTYLNNPDWLQVIGIGLENGRPCIIAYVNKIRIARKILPEEWHDIPVKIRKFGKLRPA